MNIITGYRGEPHITSGQDRAQNQGTYGTGSYILDVGRKLAAEIVSANEIRIRDGALSHQGCIANIEQGAYDSLEIANGTQGMSRIDLIVARYTKDAETNVEDIELVVIEGTAAASSPAVPSYNTGDIQAGDSPVDMPLYRVNISGVNISSVTQVASTVRTQAETDTLLGNTSISGIGGGTLTGAVSALNSKLNGEGAGIGSLTDIPVNTMGYYQLNAAISPTGIQQYFAIVCFGNANRRSYIARSTASADGLFIASYHSGNSPEILAWRKVTSASI